MIGKKDAGWEGPSPGVKVRPKTKGVAIWYYKPEYGRDMNFGAIQPTKYGLKITHTHLMDLDLCGINLDQIYHEMQGDFWSPNGEARPLLEEKGLEHTSMSVGDVIHDKDTDEYFVVARFGFNQLND